MIGPVKSGQSKLAIISRIMKESTQLGCCQKISSCKLGLLQVALFNVICVASGMEGSCAMNIMPDT
jgi:hypothetical protein